MIRARARLCCLLVCWIMLSGLSAAESLHIDSPDSSTDTAVDPTQHVASSDLLIVLDGDGRHYLAQQHLLSEGDLLVSSRPEGHIALDTRFTGPEWLIFASAHERDPARVALWSGSVLSRYRHRYGRGLTEPEPGILQLEVATEHPPVDADRPQSMTRQIGWILPANAELLDFVNTDPDATGSWRRSGPLISWHQSGGPPPSLQLRFRLHEPEPTNLSDSGSACRPGDAPSDNCSPDVDGDEIPDHRDLCLPHWRQTLAVAEPALFAHALPIATQPVRTDAELRADRRARDQLGCRDHSPITLDGIRFRPGQSYLDAASRRALDRVTMALQRLPETRFEIAVHTDNAGRVEHNRSLSQLRARRIRQYLMFSGVPGENLVPLGLGETSPAYDNALPAGRRANRRVELRALPD